MRPNNLSSRNNSIRLALKLEYFTVGWNVIECAVAVTLALLANSVALLGFGVDSAVESLSGAIIIWRFWAEIKGDKTANIEAIDRQAHKWVAVSLLLLALYIFSDSLLTLWNGERPEPSIAGVLLTSVSALIMWWLARAKKQLAKTLGSKALETDAFQTTACWWLSIITLVGVGLNTAFGWWWADPAAAIGMTFLIAKEGLEAWRGEECGCHP